MDCPEFREQYGDYKDGYLGEAAEVAFRRHLTVCPACSRFDQAYTAGLECLRTMPVASSSCQFAARLARRLGSEPLPRTSALPRWSGMAGALMVVAALGVVAWDNLRSPGSRMRVEAPVTHYRHTSASYRSVPSAAFHITRDSLARLRASFELLPRSPGHTLVWQATGGRVDVSAAWAAR